MQFQYPEYSPTIRSYREQTPPIQGSTSTTFSNIADDTFQYNDDDIQDVLQDRISEVKEKLTMQKIIAIMNKEKKIKSFGEEQQEMFEQYITLARMKSLSSFQQESKQSQVLTMKIVGINVSQQKKAMMMVRELLNKYSTARDIEQQFQQICKRESGSSIDELKTEFIEQLIQKAGVEKKFFHLYSEVLLHNPDGQQIMKVLERQLNRAFECSDYDDEELRKLNKSQMCQLLGLLSNQERFKQFCLERIDHLATQENILFCFDAAQYMFPCPDSVVTLYQNMKTAQQTTGFIDFKFEQLALNMKNKVLEIQIELSDDQSQSPSQIQKFSFLLYDLAQIETDIQEYGLFDLMKQHLGVKITPKLIKTEQVLHYLQHLSFSLITIDNQRLLRESLSQLLIDVGIKSLEAIKFYQTLSHYLIGHDPALFANPDIRDNTAHFIAQLIFQQKLQMNHAIQSLIASKMDQAAKYQFLRIVLTQIALLSVTTAVSELEDELPPSIRQLVTRCISSADPAAIYQLNCSKEYLRFARTSKFSYFDQPDCELSQIPNHFETAYIQTFQQIFQADPNLVQLLQTNFAQNQSVLDFFVNLFAQLKMKPLLNSVMKFIPAGAHVDGCKLGIYRLKTEIMSRNVEQPFCKRMAQDLLREMRADADAYTRLGLEKLE